MAATGDLPMPSALSPLPPSNCVDPADIDAFINYEQSYISPSPSSTASQGKTQPQPQQINSTGSTPTLHPSTSGFATSNQAQVLYNAPSHQYDSYKQQTGLPMGGLADTMANNRSMDMNYGYQMGFQPDMMQPMLDYSYAQRLQNPMRDTDMDMEGDVGLQYNFGQSQSTAKTEFVDPNALGGHELSPVVPPANQMGRMYPGIHQQQAARAKAQALQRQQEMLRRQQQQQQAQTPQQPQPQEQPQGQAQPEQLSHSRQNSRSGGKRPTDPLVEERISRLLQQMRQSSTASAAESMSPPKPTTQITRPKKMEEEMDEDERLLASEEGKKLSSKERRQLRNKVSARAFRSRRKEYIGQLEGEVTAKTNEANDLRLQNRALMEENARLTELTRTLLSSQHFASFLNDASVNGLPRAIMQTPPQSQMQTDSQDVQMPTPPNAMPTVAEQNFDFAALDVNGPGWNSGIDMNYNPSVFAVLEVPEPVLPELDSSILSGKGSQPLLPLSDKSKELRVIERPEPERVEYQADPDVELGETDPSFALFLDQPKTSTPEPSTRMLSEKAPRIDLVVRDGNAGEPPDISAVTARFERLRASIEGPYQRVCRFTSHLE